MYEEEDAIGRDLEDQQESDDALVNSENSDHRCHLRAGKYGETGIKNFLLPEAKNLLLAETTGAKQPQGPVGSVSRATGIKVGRVCASCGRGHPHGVLAKTFHF